VYWSNSSLGGGDRRGSQRPAACSSSRHSDHPERVLPRSLLPNILYWRTQSLKGVAIVINDEFLVVLSLEGRDAGRCWLRLWDGMRARRRVG
jgi:hypothetical protein